MSNIGYPGTDLEAMSFAVNYHKWILDEFRPYLGQNIVEVGAGTGDFSLLLVEEKPASLTLIEPSEMFDHLIANVSSDIVDLQFHKNIFENVVDEIAKKKRPDTVFYINVLEHIEDDNNELKLVYKCLQPGGHALIFVPALPWLYGNFDRRIGHFRRYVKSGIVENSKTAGFQVLTAKYFDFSGMIPWFIKYKLFRSDSLESGLIKLYDRFVVPVNRALESSITPPLGKNLLVVLQKV